MTNFELIRGWFKANKIGGKGVGTAFYQMRSILLNGYVARNAPYTLPRNPLSGGRVTRTCVDVYRMPMMTVHSVGTHLPADHLAITE